MSKISPAQRRNCGLRRVSPAPKKVLQSALREKRPHARRHGPAVDGPSLMNLAMELRKCCNHPFLLKGVKTGGSEVVGQTERKTVGACGKSNSSTNCFPDCSRKAIGV